MAAEKDWGNGYLGSLGWVCTHTAISKTDNQQGPAWTGNSAQYYVAVWMEGELGGEWIHAYAWPSPSAVRLKLPQRC